MTGWCLIGQHTLAVYRNGNYYHNVDALGPPKKKKTFLSFGVFQNGIIKFYKNLFFFQTFQTQSDRGHGSNLSCCALYFLKNDC